MTVSSYLQYLPAVLQQGGFLGKFLLAFEAVLSGLDKKELPSGEQQALLGLEQVLDSFPELFDPTRELTQEGQEFLPWLAQWVATSLRDDWSLKTKREFISQIVPLYRMRGTRQGLQKVLEYSGELVRVIDFNDGAGDTPEKKLFPGEKPDHFFGIILTLNQRNAVELARRVRRVRAIANREKPAHTVYALRIEYPTMRINDDPSKYPQYGTGIIVGDPDSSTLGTTTFVPEGSKEESK